MRALRCSLVVLVATGLAAITLLALAPSLAAPADTFEAALVRGCAACGAACAVWGWLCVLAVVVEALHDSPGTTRAATAAVPATLRRLVLAGCGVALTATAAPALAGSGADAQHGLPQVIAGLPFPSRATDRVEPEGPVVVVPGDSLWAITEQRLASGASDAEITSGWQALYARNREVVGDDPSLIRPGQHLVLPDHLEEPS